MILERCQVSRKTPRDGKLEISRESAERLERHAATESPPPLHVGDTSGPWSITTMQCSCGGSGSGHLHYFLQSELLKALQPEQRVAIDAVGGMIRVLP